MGRSGFMKGQRRYPNDPLPAAEGVASLRLLRQRCRGLSRAFRRATCSGSGCGERCRAGVARRRGASRVPQMCPECVRVFNGQTTIKCRFAGTLCKPSDGLEPSTPSLPWRFERVTRVHARSLAPQFLLQIGLILTPRGASRDVARVVSDVSVLCPRLVADVGNADALCAASPLRPGPCSSSVF